MENIGIPVSICRLEAKCSKLKYRDLWETFEEKYGAFKEGDIESIRKGSQKYQRIRDLAIEYKQRLMIEMGQPKQRAEHEALVQKREGIDSLKRILEHIDTLEEEYGQGKALDSASQATYRNTAADYKGKTDVEEDDEWEEEEDDDDDDVGFK